MKIKITRAESGLEVGREYDLCKRAAVGLISKRQALAVVPEVVKSPDSIDFSGYTDGQIAEFAVKAELPANIKNRKTIIRHLTEKGFVPDTEE